MAHCPKLVARIKGALKAGFGIKQLASITNIPAQTIKQWKHEDTRAGIEPDPEVVQDIREVLLGKFMGNPETR